MAAKVLAVFRASQRFVKFAREVLWAPKLLRTDIVIPKPAILQQITARKGTFVARGQWRWLWQRQTTTLVSRMRDTILGGGRAGGLIATRNYALLGFCTTLAVINKEEDVQVKDTRYLIDLMKEAAEKALERSASLESSPEWDITRCADLEFGPYMAKGSYGAVYAAKKKEGTEDLVTSGRSLSILDWSEDERGSDRWPLAVKMLFNLSDSSNGQVINRCFAAEQLTNKIPRHPSIIHLEAAFTDQVPLLPGAYELYPNSLPKRLCPPGMTEEDCFGRNHTLFLVMNRYPKTLRQLLREGPLPPKVATQILVMLLEGDAHLKQEGIAHRDIKTDNILVAEAGDGSYVSILSDFGCAFRPKNLKVPYTDDGMDLGGNVQLMAPEIVCAMSNKPKFVDFSRADLWTIGTIAYELYGQDNPFYKTLSNSNYQDEDVPLLDTAPPVVAALVKSMLRRDPRKRLSSDHCADILQVLLMQPPADWLRSIDPSPVEARDWLLRCFTGDYLRSGWRRLVRLYFYRRFSFDRLMWCLAWIRRNNHELVAEQA